MSAKVGLLSTARTVARSRLLSVDS
jgi:hypothetical protein